HRVLGDLYQDRIARVQGLFDTPRLTLQTGGVPVHLTGIQHGVAALAQVHERGFHRGQHILHPAQVDIAHHRGLELARHVVLDQDIGLELRDLRAAVLGALHHLALGRLAPGEELCLGDPRAAAFAAAALLAALPLGLQAGGPLQRGDFVLRIGGVLLAVAVAAIAIAVAAAPASSAAATTAATTA